MNVSRLFLLSACGAVLLSTVGCGGRPLPEGTTGTVKGRLTIEGEPAESGTVITMTHSTGGHAATGTVKSDGYFSMRFRDGTKLITGIYQVGITAAGAAGTGDVQPGTAEYEKIMSAGGNVEEFKPPFAARYTNPATSGEEFEVSEGSNELNLDLKKQ